MTIMIDPEWDDDQLLRQLQEWEGEDTSLDALWDYLKFGGVEYADRCVALLGHDNPRSYEPQAEEIARSVQYESDAYQYDADEAELEGLIDQQSEAAGAEGSHQLTPAEAEDLLDLVSINVGNTAAIKYLCETGTSITFTATSKYVVFSLVDADSGDAALLGPYALTGSLEFTRNRTRPNMFSFESIVVAYAPAGFNSDRIGEGNDAALDNARATLQQLIRDPDVYPYRDASRVGIRSV